MVTVEDREQQKIYYTTVREEFAYEGRATSFLMWLCRVLTFITPFGIRVNYSRRDGSAYQLRVYLTPKWIPWGFGLHHFFRSDQDPEYHNHPWHWFKSLILLHGYIEHYLEKDTRRECTRDYAPRQWNTLRNTTYERTWHRLELRPRPGPFGPPLRPWTLFFHGRRIKDESDGIDSWGFINVATGRYMGWRAFVNQPPSRHEIVVSDVVAPVLRDQELDIAVDPDPTPPRGTTFDMEEAPTTPIPADILKEARDATLRTGVPGESKPGACSTDQEGTP